MSSGKMKVFITTSAYGAMAGALTGMASLAFYDTASSHTKNIAVGASLGLYTGILLSAYIIYGADMMKETPEDRRQREREDKQVDLLGRKGFQGIFVAYDKVQRPNVGFAYRF
jgi:hypothetical protein